MNRFRIVGLIGVCITLAWLGSTLGKIDLAHVIIVPMVGLAATWVMGGIAERVRLDRGRWSALLMGPLSALCVLLAGVIAVVLGNAPALVSQPGEFSKWVLAPLVWGLLMGAIPALVAGVLCGLAVALSPGADRA